MDPTFPEIAPEIQFALGFWGWLIVVIVVIVVSTAVALLIPVSTPTTSDPDEDQVDEFDIATAEEGRVVPRLYGRRLMVPNLIAFFDYAKSTIKKSGQSAGIKHRWSWVYVPCGKSDKVLELWADGKRVDDIDDSIGVVQGTPPLGEFFAQTGERAQINSSNTGKSKCYFFDGTQTAAIMQAHTVEIQSRGAKYDDCFGIEQRFLNFTGNLHAYLLARIGVDILYREMTLIVCPRAFVGDNVRTFPNYKFVVERTAIVSGWKNDNMDGDANPAAMIHDMLTLDVEVPASMIDSVNFQAVNDVLWVEDMGLSVGFNKPRTADKWIANIERHADVKLIFDEVTGKFKLKLIRDDYLFDISAPTADPGNTGDGVLTGVIAVTKTAVAESWTITHNGTDWDVTGSVSGLLATKAVDDTRYDGGPIKFVINAGGVAFVIGDEFTFSFATATIPTVDASQYKDLDWVRKGWEDTFTDVTVKWVSRETWKERSHREVNPASRAIIGAVTSQTLSFPMITRNDVITQVVARIKRRLFYPLGAGNFKVANTVYDPTVGDVFDLKIKRITGAGDVITTIRSRVLDVSGKSSEDQTNRIECVEDIFGIGTADTVTIPDPGNVPPDLRINNVPQFGTVKDATPEITAFAGRRSIQEFDRRVMVLAAIPLSTSPFAAESVQINFLADDEEQKEEDQITDFAATGLLTADYGITTPIDPGSFTVDAAIEIDDVSHTDEEWQRGDTLVIIDDGTASGWEIMSVKTIVDNGGGSFTFTGLIRGAWGTDIQAFSNNDRVWILNDGPSDLFASVFYVDERRCLGLTLPVRMKGINRAGGIGPEATINHTYAYRPETPYDPTALVGFRSGNNIAVTWEARRRKGGAFEFDQDQVAVNEGSPEPGWEVTGSDGFGPQLVSDTSFNRIEASTVTYTVKSIINGRKSTGKTVAI